MDFIGMGNAAKGVGASQASIEEEVRVMVRLSSPCPISLGHGELSRTIFIN